MNLKRLLPTSEFNKNILTLITGTGIAQAIPIAITPILTRLYTPEDFGVLAIFMSLSLIFGTIANARYELAIMLPETEEEALNVAKLGIILTTLVSVLLLVIVLFFKAEIALLLNNPLIENWLFFVPITVWFVSFFNVLNYYNTRKKKFKNISEANVTKSVALAVSQLSLNFLKGGPFGLIAGYIISNFSGNFKLFKNSFSSIKDLGKFEKQEIKSVASKYIEFPKFSLGAAIANTLSLNLSGVLISIVFSVKTLGFYSLCQKILGLPINLIGQSISQVFFQKSAEKAKDGTTPRGQFLKTIKKLFVLGTPIFVVLFFIVEPAFEIAFGSDWKIAGTYAKILVPLYLARFIVVPVSILNVVYKKNHVGFYWQSGLLLVQFGIILVSYLMEIDFKTFLIIFSVVSSFYYLLLLLIIDNYLKPLSNV